MNDSQGSVKKRWRRISRPGESLSFICALCRFAIVIDETGRVESHDRCGEGRRESVPIIGIFRREAGRDVPTLLAEIGYHRARPYRDSSVRGWKEGCRFPRVLKARKPTREPTSEEWRVAWPEVVTALETIVVETLRRWKTQEKWAIGNILCERGVFVTVSQRDRPVVSALLRSDIARRKQKHGDLQYAVYRVARRMTAPLSWYTENRLRSSRPAREIAAILRSVSLLQRAVLIRDIARDARVSDLVFMIRNLFRIPTAEVGTDGSEALTREAMMLWGQFGDHEEIPLVLPAEQLYAVRHEARDKSRRSHAVGCFVLELCLPSKIRALLFPDSPYDPERVAEKIAARVRDTIPPSCDEDIPF